MGRVAVRLGIFVVPDATAPARTVEQVLAAERVGLDVVGIQDHPYQRRFFDTWTLLSWLAARTERVRLVPDVVNLPLRPPALLAKAAASLDVLSGGRVEVGIGAGAFWEAIAAMGGPRRTPKESVDALEEAIAVLRAAWGMERTVDVRGEHYDVHGFHPGPAPAHPIGLWIGAYGPRMLRITGRLGDGWLPSLGPHFLAPDDIPTRQAAIDEAARAAGRDPAAIERVVNVIGAGTTPGALTEHLLGVTALGFTTLLVSVPDGDDDPAGFVRMLGEDVAPRVRERAD
jgi:alkanesulfonate monooxygenase SsuD/methylene tetrahydromethanopterin reductase-like flavin-dependent oxidoreductase (luciferase family)